MKRKHHIRSDNSLSLFGSAPKAVRSVERTVRIEFDGGTPCNIPRLGYGNGYGSYKIDNEPIYRLNFRRPMSANVAEITTLTRAIQTVAQNHNPETTKLEIYGDSKIALSRCLKAKRSVELTDFSAACGLLSGLCQSFAQVETHWRGREASVKLFGH